MEMGTRLPPFLRRELRTQRHFRPTPNGSHQTRTPHNFKSVHVKGEAVHQNYLRPYIRLSPIVKSSTGLLGLQ